MCVSGLPTVPKFRSPTLIFLLSFLVFYNWFFSQKSVFNFKYIFVATSIKNNLISKSVFVTFTAQLTTCQTRSKLLAIENEGAMGRDTTWQTENVNIAVLFYKNILQANKIIAKNKKIIRPTYPNCKKQVTGNTYFFVWPYLIFLFKHYKLYNYFENIFLWFVPFYVF